MSGVAGAVAGVLAAVAVLLGAAGGGAGRLRHAIRPRPRVSVADRQVSRRAAAFRLPDRHAEPVDGARDTDVAELAERLAALTRAGLAMTSAWSALSRVPGQNRATAAAVAAQVSAGADIGSAVRSAPGPASLRWLATACQVAERAGAPLATVLDGFVRGLRSDQQAAADRDAALAGPRATGAVLSALPIAGMGLGLLLGANPLITLLSTTAGRAVLIVGSAFWIAGKCWISRLIARAERAGATG